MLSTLNFRILFKADVEDINDAMQTFLKYADILTAPARQVIVEKIVTDSVNIGGNIVSLKEILSMELRAKYWLESMQSLTGLSIVVDENGLVTYGSVIPDILTIEWNKFQLAVFYECYRKQLGENWRLTALVASSMRRLSLGINSYDLERVYYTDILGVASTLMKAGADMNIAWLLAQQIRKAYSVLYNLQNVDQFHLGLINQAELAAMSGLLLRQFSIREMEGVDKVACNEMIGKMGDLYDNYLVPHPRRREIVCFYFARCRLISDRRTGTYYTPGEEQYYNPEFDHPADADNFYCNDLSEQVLREYPMTQSDFDTLGTFICDAPAIVFEIVDREVLNDNLWMFSQDCFLNYDQGQAVFGTILKNQIYSATKLTREQITSLGHSLCSVVPKNQASLVRNRSYGKEIIDFVQYAYDDAFEKDLTKRHLSRALYWFRGISQRQQNDIFSCYMSMTKIAHKNFDLRFESIGADSFYDIRITSGSFIFKPFATA